MRELNNDTSKVIERVEAGETVEVTKRGKVVARITPTAPDRKRLAMERILAAPEMDVPDVPELLQELDDLRARRA